MAVMDHRRLNRLLIVLALLSCISCREVAHAQHSGFSTSLLGRWQCQSEAGPIPLVFQSKSTMVLDGEPADYTLVPGAIRIEEEYGFVDYGYALQGDTLLISFPGGLMLECMREASLQGRGAETPGPEGLAAPAASTPGQSSGSSKIAAGEVGDPSWGFKFRPPAGWEFSKNLNGAILGHDTVPGMILVFPHQQTNLQAVAQQMEEGLVEEAVYLMPSTQLEQKGSNMLAGECAGTWQGQHARGRSIGTLSPHGGGAYVLAITTPERYGKEIAGAADAIAEGMHYFKIDVSNLERIFVGRWAAYSGSSGGATLRNYTFYPDATFSDDRETSYSSDYSGDGGGMPDSYVGGVGTSHGHARWKVGGGEREGQIIITFPDGSENVIDYRVHVQRGETYWREYWFNGRLFRKQDTF
jgi:hypothetical protein